MFLELVVDSINLLLNFLIVALMFWFSGYVWGKC